MSATDLSLTQKGGLNDNSPLLFDKSKRWNGWTIELNPKTKTALKVAACVAAFLLGATFLALALATPFTWPVAVLVFMSLAGAMLLGGSAIWPGKILIDKVHGKREAEANEKRERERILGQAREIRKKEEANRKKEEIDRIQNGLGDLLFFQHLFALDDEGDNSRISLGIISAGLKKTPFGKEKYIEELKQAYDQELKQEYQSDLLLRSKPSKEEAQKILQAVKNEENQLLSCSFKTEKSRHAVGVRLSKDPASKAIICSIFNSGYGVADKHEQTFDKSILSSNGTLQFLFKPDLEYRVRIPSDQLTPDIIQSILNRHLTIEEIYTKITDLPGAVRITAAQKGKNARTQRPQKGKNCSLEWIFAYLKYHMSEIDYYEMRQMLFDLAFAEGLKNPKILTLIQQDAKVRHRVAESVAKKRVRVEAYKKVAEGMPREAVSSYIKNNKEKHLQEIYSEIEQATQSPDTFVTTDFSTHA